MNGILFRICVGVCVLMMAYLFLFLVLVPCSLLFSLSICMYLLSRCMFLNLSIFYVFMWFIIVFIFVLSICLCIVRVIDRITILNGDLVAETCSLAVSMLNGWWEVWCRLLCAVCMLKHMGSGAVCRGAVCMVVMMWFCVYDACLLCAVCMVMPEKFPKVNPKMVKRPIIKYSTSSTIWIPTSCATMSATRRRSKRCTIYY